MALGDFQFNIAKGQTAAYFKLAAASTGAIIVVALESDGISTDETLVDLDTLEDVLASGTTAEQTTMGRKTLSGASVTVTTVDGSDLVKVDLASDITYSAVAASDEVGKLLFCYDANTGSGDDGDIVPLLAYDFTVTPSGIDIIVAANSSGLITSS